MRRRQFLSPPLKDSSHFLPSATAIRSSASNGIPTTSTAITDSYASFGLGRREKARKKDNNAQRASNENIVSLNDFYSFNVTPVHKKRSKLKPVGESLVSVNDACTPLTGALAAIDAINLKTNSPNWRAALEFFDDAAYAKRDVTPRDLSAALLIVADLYAPWVDQGRHGNQMFQRGDMPRPHVMLDWVEKHIPEKSFCVTITDMAFGSGKEDFLQLARAYTIFRFFTPADNRLKMTFQCLRQFQQVLNKIEGSNAIVDDPVFVAISTLCDIELKRDEKKNESKTKPPKTKPPSTTVVNVQKRAERLVAALKARHIEPSTVCVQYRNLFAFTFVSLIKVKAAVFVKFPDSFNKWMNEFGLPEQVYPLVAKSLCATPNTTSTSSPSTMSSSISIQAFQEACSKHASDLEQKIASGDVIVPESVLRRGKALQSTTKDLAWSYVLDGAMLLPVSWKKQVTPNHEGSGVDKNFNVWPNEAVATLKVFSNLLSAADGARITPQVAGRMLRQLFNRGVDPAKIDEHIVAPYLCDAEWYGKVYAREFLASCHRIYGSFTQALNDEHSRLDLRTLKDHITTLGGNGLNAAVLADAIKSLAVLAPFRSNKYGEFCLDLIVRQHPLLGINKCQWLLQALQITDLKLKHKIESRLDVAFAAHIKRASEMDIKERVNANANQMQAINHGSVAEVSNAKPGTWRVAMLQLYQSMKTENPGVKHHAARAMALSVVGGRWQLACALYARHFLSGENIPPQVAPALSAAMVKGNVWWGAMEALQALARTKPTQFGGATIEPAKPAKIIADVFEVYRNKQRWEECLKLTTLLQHTQASAQWLKPVAHFIVDSLESHPKWQQALEQIFPSSSEMAIPRLLSQEIKEGTVTKLHESLLLLHMTKNPQSVKKLKEQLIKQKFSPQIKAALENSIVRTKVMKKSMHLGEHELTRLLGVHRKQLESIALPKAKPYMEALANSSYDNFPTTPREDLVKDLHNIISFNLTEVDADLMKHVYRIGTNFGVMATIVAPLLEKLAKTFEVYQSRAVASQPAQRRTMLTAVRGVQKTVHEFRFLVAAATSDAATLEQLREESSRLNQATVVSPIVFKYLTALMPQNYAFFAKEKLLHRITHTVDYDTTIADLTVQQYINHTLRVPELVSLCKKGHAAPVKPGDTLFFNMDPAAKYAARFDSGQAALERLLVTQTFSSPDAKVKYAALFKPFGVSVVDLVGWFSFATSTAVRPLYNLSPEHQGIIVFVSLDSPLVGLEAQLYGQVVAESYRDDFGGKTLSDKGEIGFLPCSANWINRYKANIKTCGEKKGSIKVFAEVDLGSVRRGIPSNLNALTMEMATEGWRVVGNTLVETELSERADVSTKQLLSVTYVDILSIDANGTKSVVATIDGEKRASLM